MSNRKGGNNDPPNMEGFLPNKHHLGAEIIPFPRCPDLTEDDDLENDISPEEQRDNEKTRFIIWLAEQSGMTPLRILAKATEIGQGAVEEAQLIIEVMDNE